MTEAEWLAATAPDEMLSYLRGDPGRASNRKLRLLACACCRQVWDLLTDARSRSTVEVAERFADGRATPRDQAAALNDAVAAAGRGRQAAWAAYWAANRQVRDSILNACGAAAEGRADAIVAAARVAARGLAAAFDAAHAGAAREQARLVRECFGNPFRIPIPAPAWLAWNNGTVPRMARAIYDERAFDRLPILADALEEAGCADADILTHCRGSEHVRGCWVLDILLGKD